MRKDELQRLRGKTGRVLRELGVPEHLNGYTYLLEAVELAASDPPILRKMTRALYPAVAEKYSTTPAASERAIRLAIETAWLRCDPDVQRCYFGNTINPRKGKPSNSEFITRVLHAVHQEVVS